MLKLIKSTALSLTVALALGWQGVSASLVLPGDEAEAARSELSDGDPSCPSSTLDIYFPAFESDVSEEAAAMLMRLALLYLRCDVDRIEVSGLAVSSVAPDSTRDIAAARGESVAGLLRVFFLGRADVVVGIEETDTAFGPETRRAKVRLLT
ncbi:MAG: hypothetical protein AAFY85_03050 [Pseudomonadota bacterium]